MSQREHFSLISGADFNFQSGLEVVPCLINQLDAFPSAILECGCRGDRLRVPSSTSVNWKSTPAITLNQAHFAKQFLSPVISLQENVKQAEGMAKSSFICIAHSLNYRGIKSRTIRPTSMHQLLVRIIF